MLPNSCHIKSLIISSNEKHHTITSKIKYKIEAHLWMRGGVTRVTTNLLLSQMTDVWSHPGHRCALLSEKWRGESTLATIMINTRPGSLDDTTTLT